MSSPSAHEQRVYAHLRTISSGRRELPAVDIVSGIVCGLSAGQPLERIAAEAGMNVEDAIELIDSFGDWLRLSYKTATDHLLIDNGAVAIDSLFRLEDIDAGAAAALRAARADPKASKRQKAAAEKLLTRTFDGTIIDIPAVDGLTTEDAHARRVARIVAMHPDSDTIHRFIDRRWHQPAPLLCADHLLLLAWLGQTGLWRKLDRLTDTHVSFATALVSAWDVFDVYLGEAHDALDRIQGALATTAVLDAGSLDLDLEAAGWLYHTEVNATRKVVRAFTDNPSSHRLVTIAVSKLRSLSTQPRVSTVTSVDTGAASRLASRLGFDGGDQKTVREQRNRWRNRLRAEGLVEHLDIDLDEALLADVHGLGEQFLQSRRDRANGVGDWEARWHACAAQSQLMGTGMHR